MEKQRQTSASIQLTCMDCIPCLMRLNAEAICLARPDHIENEALYRETLRMLAEADWKIDPPILCQKAQRLIREKTGCRDPYKKIKENLNIEALRALDDIKKLKPANMSNQEAAVRIAIGANSLDSTTKTSIQMPEAIKNLKFLYEKPIVGDWEALFHRVKKADKILYLTDNAGEIVFDRVLLEELPLSKVIVAVRGFPVLNDATMEDAKTAGLDAMAPIISNGSDAPGTVIEDCSEEFRALFEKSDLVIAKGQGNFETLRSTEKPIIFLFQVKCGVIARYTNLPLGTMAVLENR